MNSEPEYTTEKSLHKWIELGPLNLYKLVDNGELEIDET